MDNDDIEFYLSFIDASLDKEYDNIDEAIEAVLNDFFFASPEEKNGARIVLKHFAQDIIT